MQKGWKSMGGEGEGNGGGGWEAEWREWVEKREGKMGRKVLVEERRRKIRKPDHDCGAEGSADST